MSELLKEQLIRTNSQLLRAIKRYDECKGKYDEAFQRMMELDKQRNTLKVLLEQKKGRPENN